MTHGTPPIIKAQQLKLRPSLSVDVETVIVAGKIRKWKGRLLDANLTKLRRDLEASRDHLFAQAGIRKDLFRAS
jgi:hypothetical protein